MMINSPGLVTLDALLRSTPVPGVWAATMAYDRFCWQNQESGWRSAAAGLPDWDDVQKLIMEVMER